VGEINMENYLALKASAGSGKTFALTIRYISLLFFDISPNEILTLTFTNRAASQMSKNIYDTLFTLEEDSMIIDAISKQTNLSYKDIIGKKQSVIDVFISSSLSIFTIDKFINKILREFSGYANINDDFVIEYDDEELLLYKFLTSLDENQFNNLIKFAYIENKKLNSIIKLFKILDEKNEELKCDIPTFKSWQKLQNKIMDRANTIKLFINRSQLSNSAKKAVDFEDVKSLLSKGKTWLTKLTLQEFIYFKKVDIPLELEDNFKILKTNLELYFKYKELITLSGLFKIFHNFKAFRRKYNKNKNSLEFNDITNTVYELLQKHIDRDFLYFRLDSNYSNILIDEFQDTSVLQYKILEPLIEEIMSGSSEKFKSFFYVGDTKQSIYRFRGGAKELFDYVANKFKYELKVDILDVNYRSSKNVVEFVNNNFQNLPNYEYHPQKIFTNREGCVEVVDFNCVEENIYKDVANKVNELINIGIDINNIAILTYTNSDVLSLYLYLKQIFPNLQISTDMTSKLINTSNIQATINMIKYLYFKEDIYKANFNALVGNDIMKENEQNFSIFNISMRELIFNIAMQFNLIDENMIKFIELVERYSNIVDFIYDIDKMDASRMFEDKHGIQILTVFKAKGLEFDTVLVLDRIKRKNSNKSPLLFEYENINIKNIFYKQSGRESFNQNGINQDYTIATQKEKELELDDNLNVLYVALTRAKNNMIIFKKQKNSVFDILKNNCKISKIGNLYINKIKLKDINDNLQLDYKSLNLGQQEKQIKTKISDEYNIKARYFGIATHYCLEIMSDFTQENLDISINSSKNKYSNILNDNDFKDIYQRIKMLINNIEFRKILKNGIYFKEQALMFEKELKILDLLVKKHDKYTICDYKTTSTSKDEHFRQVKYYHKAISKIVGTSFVDAYIIYLGKKMIEIVKVV
jgi:exodeoxyribonuclease V beta subunit